MNSFYCYPNVSFDQVSVEANSDGLSFQPDPLEAVFGQDFSSLFDCDIFATGINVSGVCESADLADSMTHCVEPNEFDKYLGPKLSSNPSFDIDQNLLALNNTLPIHVVEKTKKARSNKKPISLSSSVGVGVPQRSLKPSHKIEIVNELEETYRPRYKSDYFAQNGKQRRPRYVTDRHGNHYVTLKVPVGIHGKIRVDWLTIPNANGDRYYMPYRFQADNDNADVADCNPIFLDIASDVTGTLKVYLVLIKAKQDALKSLQPLVAYHPMQDALGIIDKKTPEKSSKLTAKQLIQKHQLGKSQLAFTFCTVGAGGQACPEWDTTAYSTVLEEAPDSSPTKTVTCPKCEFQIIINDDDVTEQEIGTNKRKSPQIKAGKPKPVKRQKSFPEILQCFN